MAESAPGKSSFGNGNSSSELRHLQEPRVVIHPVAERLQAAQVVRDAEFRAQLLEDLPVALSMLHAEPSFEARAQLGPETVVVEQRIVHIEQKYGLTRAVPHQHGAEVSAVGLCQLSPSSMTLSASAGPQVPGS